MPIKYSLSFPNRLTHFIHVSIEIQTPDLDETTFILPSWRPGRYELANFVSNIKSMEVIGDDGKRLNHDKTASNQWKVVTRQQKTITVNYSYYANKMDAGSSVIDEEQIYINFVNCLLYVEEYLNEATEITLDLPDDFKTVCALSSLQKNTYKAPSFYALVDAPLLSTQKLNQFFYTVDDCKFVISVKGKMPIGEEEIIADFEKFSKAQIQQMGGFPTKEYHFIIQSLPYKHYHGVEHQNSTVLVLGPNTQKNKQKYYEDMMGVASHELFHTWNVTRIRPKELSPYRFSKENYYETGFVTEGFTTYYGDLFLARGGVYNQEQYFNELNIIFKRHFENYGRHNLSLVASSYDLWIDGYKKILPSRKVSIYVKGATVALMADLMIRANSDNKHSLDDVISDLWLGYGKKGRGYSKQDVYDILKKYGGEKMPEFIDKYYEGTEAVEAELSQLLTHIGCELMPIKHPEKTADYFGFRIDKGLVIEIAPDSIAESTLSIGDKIIKINEKELTKESLNAVEKTTSLEIKRNSKRRNITLKNNGEGYYQVYEIGVIDSSSEKTDNNRNSWLGL